MKRLSFDTSRCLGNNCNEKESCLRFTDRPQEYIPEGTIFRLSMVASLRELYGPCKFKIGENNE